MVEGGEPVFLVIGIAASGDEHVGVLASLAEAVEDEAVLNELIHTADPEVILKHLALGGKGALMVSNAGHALVPGFRVRPIDTTAAGDVFNGALALALAEGFDLRAAVLYANAAAAISVTRMGAQPSAPTRKQILELLGQRQ